MSDPTGADAPAPDGEPMMDAPPAEPPAPPAKSRAEMRAETWAGYKADIKWATPLLFVMILAGAVVFPALIQGLPGGPAPWTNVTAGEESMSDISNITFATGATNTSIAQSVSPTHTEPGLVVPFEILSVLLLAALIAGVVIALRDHDNDQGAR